METEEKEVTESTSTPLSSTPAPYAETIKKKLSEPDLMDRVFAHISNGGDLITFSQNLDIRVSDLSIWINADIERIKKYTVAVKMCEEWIRARIIKELAAIALVDVRGLFKEDGSMKDMSDWPESAARAVAGIEVDEIWEGRGAERAIVGYTKKVKLTDKIKSLELIGRQMGMFAQKHDVRLSKTLEDIVAGSHEPTAT